MASVIREYNIQEVIYKHESSFVGRRGIYSFDGILEQISLLKQSKTEVTGP